MKKRQEMLRPRELGDNVDHWMSKRGKLFQRKMSANEKINYKQIFDLLDREHTGTVSFEDLYQSMTERKIKMSRSELSSIMSSFNKKELSYNDFIGGFASVSEWDRLFKIRARRLERGSTEPALPVAMWVSHILTRAQFLKGYLGYQGYWVRERCG